MMFSTCLRFRDLGPLSASLDVSPKAILGDAIAGIKDPLLLCSHRERYQNIKRVNSKRHQLLRDITPPSPPRPHLLLNSFLLKKIGRV